LLQGTLTEEELGNPFLVFQNAFHELSIRDFDFFLCECIHLALSPYSASSSYNPNMLLQHLLKIFEAAKIIQMSNINK